MTYTNQLMNFETHQLKLHLPEILTLLVDQTQVESKKTMLNPMACPEY